jgi:agmatine deiminase
VAWIFNGWVGQEWARWDHDAKIGRTRGRRGDPRRDRERGRRHPVDGLGTVLATRTVQLDPGRNPGATRHDIERRTTSSCARTGRSSPATADAHDRALEVVRLPAPTILREDFVDFTYINHLVINDAVIVPAFDDPRDERAAAIIVEQYPGRQIRTVRAHPIFRQGGGVHCITQQEPAAS